MSQQGDQEINVMQGLRTVLSKIELAVARRSKVSTMISILISASSTVIQIV